VICADIKMMFRQILIRKSDRQHQHIYFREEETNQVREFELNTVTYGLTCSPYLAQRTLLQLVQDEGNAFPLASKAICEATYVDDIVTGANSISEANTLISELNQLLRKGGFELRKWSANNASILRQFPEEYLENPAIFAEEDSQLKILGLRWDPRQDVFTYELVPFSDSATKRTVLSYIARMYDPLGFLTPLTFWIKYFLQLLWLAKLDWDDALPEHLLEQWKTFTDQLKLICSFTIPRQVGNSSASYNLLGFADASTKGYAACIYLHSTYSTGTVVTHLLRAKSKVAPIKTTTVRSSHEVRSVVRVDVGR
jgi:hypothetical protein